MLNRPISIAHHRAKLGDAHQQKLWQAEKVANREHEAVRPVRASSIKCWHHHHHHRIAAVTASASWLGAAAPKAELAAGGGRPSQNRRLLTLNYLNQINKLAEIVNRRQRGRASPASRGIDSIIAVPH